MQASREFLPHTNTFVKDYLENNKQARSFFDYGLSEDEFKRRDEEIMQRTYPREALYDVLYTYNHKLTYHQRALQELEKLKDPESAVVITGQQAGFLTGPMYTIYKAITVLKEAEEKERLLQKPVLPIFWIAGEDHDWEEINHVYLPGNTTPQKVSYKGFFEPGQPVSEQPVQETVFETWWSRATELLHETDHTHSLYHTLGEMVEKADSMTDFFAEVLRWLFRDTGLIMLDANDPALRKLETEIFQSLIYDNHSVRDAVQTGMKEREMSVYKRLEGFQVESAQFFYHFPHRLLLFETTEAEFTDKHDQHKFSKEFLEQEAASHPERFSSNALTRPLVQEMILPVLAYAAGPGEINYWSVLKPLFHHFHRSMPPIIPRVEATMVPRVVQTIIHKEDVSLAELLRNGAAPSIQAVQRKAAHVDGRRLADELLQEIEPLHGRMQEEWEKIAPSEKSFGETNWKMIQDDVLTFARKIDQYQINQQNDRTSRLEKAGQLIVPFNAPQERTYNILLFLNEYGSRFVLDLMAVINHQYGQHHVIIL